VEAAASRRALIAVAASALIAATFTLAPTANARRTASPSLVVTFSAAGAVSVALPDGTPVGTTSGTPTLIPAGFYTLVLNGPGSCITLPLFELRGPGVNINDDMLGGETDTHMLDADFQPNATYTWYLDRSQNIVYTFRTSSTVVGSPPNANTSPTTSGGHAVPTSQDVTGSAILPFRGTLTVAVSAAGRLSLAYKGRPVTGLKAGRYTIAAVDRSTASGVMLEKSKHAATSLTGVTFVGKRSASVALTAGTWLFMPRLGKSAFSIAVS
jgi:hypothetical protein